MCVKVTSGCFEKKKGKNTTTNLRYNSRPTAGRLARIFSTNGLQKR